MHRLLRRQLNKLALSADVPPDRRGWFDLLERIGQSYEQADLDRYTLERSLNISSDEMQDLYKQLKSTSEARMRALTDALPDLVYLVDEDGRYLEIFAGGAAEMLHRPVGELLGKRINETVPPGIAAALLLDLHRALAGKEMRQLEYRLELQGGSRDFEARIVATGFDVEGKATAVMLVRDISGRKQAEARDRLAAKVVDAVAEGVVIMDSERLVQSVNPACTAITGLAPPELVGKQPSFLKDVSDAGVLNAAFAAVAQGGSWAGEVTARRADGAIFPLWLTLDSVRTPDGEIDHFVALLSDVSEIKRSREELEHVASHDALTGLPNRMLLQDRLAMAVARSRRNVTAGAILFMDLDRFKTINDTLGHHVGDELLKAVAKRLTEVARKQDTVVRLGGDEFVLLLEDLKKETHAGRIAAKLLEIFQVPFRCGGYRLEISPSIGISVFPRDGEQVEVLLKHADAAMYAAKDGGRNRYRYFTEELTDSAQEYFALEQALRKGLVRGELFVRYQPQYDLDTSRLCGLEALVRWQHPTRGEVRPVEFIQVAEHSGLIGLLGAKVLEMVVTQIQDWLGQGIKPVPVAVNLSPRQLAEVDMAAQVLAVLRRHGVAPQFLELELTESAIIRHEDVAFRNLHELSDEGIRLAIDDFGTGHSSLINLKRFPLNKVKIDKGFVRDVAHDANDEAIIRAIVAMAESLGLAVIAEGVETETQLAFLRSVGCREVQGYLLGRPADGSEITKLLRAGGEMPRVATGDR